MALPLAALCRWNTSLEWPFGVITCLLAQAGQGLLFMCLILSALILGAVKNLKMTVQEEQAGAVVLQENLAAAQGQPKLTWLCLVWECPSYPGWSYSDLIQQCEQAVNC